MELRNDEGEWQGAHLKMFFYFYFTRMKQNWRWFIEQSGIYVIQILLFDVDDEDK